MWSGLLRQTLVGALSAASDHQCRGEIVKNMLAIIPGARETNSHGTESEMRGARSAARTTRSG